VAEVVPMTDDWSMVTMKGPAHHEGVMEGGDAV
jgi:hypothetical protein